MPTEEQVLALRRQGMRNIRIAKKLGVSKTWVWNIVSRHGFSGVPPLPVKPKPCKECGKEFVTKNQYERRTRKFCSKECQYRSFIDLKGKASRHGVISLKCEFCQKKFKRQAYLNNICKHKGTKHDFCCHRHFLRWLHSKPKMVS